MKKQELKVAESDTPPPVRCLKCGMRKSDHTRYENGSYCPARGYTTRWTPPKTPFLTCRYNHNGTIVELAVEFSGAEIIAKAKKLSDHNKYPDLTGEFTVGVVITVTKLNIP